MKRGIIIGAILLFSLNLFGQLPYQDPKLTSEARAKDLISRLSLQEKAAPMCDQSEAIPRLGIKKFNWWSEAILSSIRSFDFLISHSLINVV